DQRQHRDGLTDAGRMHPDQRSFRARAARLAKALAESRALLLAARQPTEQEEPHQRPRQNRGGAIEAERAHRLSPGAVALQPTQRSASAVWAIMRSSTR